MRGQCGCCSLRKLALLMLALGFSLAGLKVALLKRPSCAVQTTVTPEPTAPPVHHQPSVFMSRDYELYLHAALLDDRRTPPTVRVYGVHNTTALPKHFWCRFRDATGNDVTKQAAIFEVDHSWSEWSPYFAVELDCKVPEGARTDTVTIFSKERPFSAEMRVERSEKETPRRQLAVCVKPMTGGFSIPRLVEWFEVFRAVGVEDFIIYTTYISDNSRYVLKYFEQEGILRTRDFPFLSATISNIEVKRQLTPEERYATYQQIYLVAMHNCFYRFRAQYEYMLFIDIDEVITPPSGMTLQQVLDKARKIYTTAASYLFLTAWHFEEHDVYKSDPKPPEYLYMQKYLYATNPIDNQPKGITVVDRTITINFHTAVDVFKKGYSNELLPADEYGYLHHYRGKCSDKFPAERCKNLLSDKRKDPSIPRFRGRVDSKVKQVLATLKLTPEIVP